MSGKDPFLLHLQMLEDNIYGMRLNLEVLITTFKLTNLRALKPMDNLCAEMLFGHHGITVANNVRMGTIGETIKCSQRQSKE